MADERKAPDGYEYQWLPDDDWVIGGDWKRCRMKKCTNVAVARLKRKRHTVTGTSIQLWGYCADHLYGRKIEGGKVLVQTLRAKE